jgi:hypothetical protein
MATSASLFLWLPDYAALPQALLRESSTYKIFF